jgi:hypothetical protein
LPAIVGIGLFVTWVPAPAARAAADLTPVGQQVSLDAPPQADPTIVRSRYVLMTTGILPAPSLEDQQRGVPTPNIRLDLFDDVSVVAVFDRFDKNPRGVTWVGRVQGSEGSTVTLVYGDDGLVQGNVLTLDGTYTIRPAPDDVRAARPQADGVLHVIAQIDLSKGRRRASAVSVAIPAAAGGASTASLGPQSQPDSPGFIDLMVVYTPGAAAAVAGGATGLRNRIDLMVSEVNTSFSNSGVTQRLRLAHVAQVPYETVIADLTYSTDLENLRNGAPGLEGVAALRNLYSADLVTMIGRNDSFFPAFPACSNAYQMDNPSAAFEAFAFSVVDIWCTSTTRTFAEALATNMGLRYDWFTDNSTTPYTYAHGHVNPVGDGNSRFRTLMADFMLCNAYGVACQTLLRWSNPDQTLNGVPLGVPAGTRADCAVGALDANTCDADARLALNNTAPFVANFRDAPETAPGEFSKTGPADQTILNSSSTLLSWQTASFVESYEYCYDTTNNDACDGSWIPITATSAQVTGVIPSTTYYWQVRALNAHGVTQANGSVWWRFSRQAQLPAAFNKIAPANSAVGQPVGLTLSWQVSTDAASYEYCYDTTNNSACDGSWTSTAATSASVTGLGTATTYYWHVRSLNPTGTVGADGNAWWSFATTATGPAYPVITLAGFAYSYGSTDGIGSVARFSSPTGVAADAAGIVYVADSSNGTIRKITPTGKVATFAGLAGFYGSTDGTGSAARFQTPVAVAVDNAGTVYVAERYTIRKITPAGVVTTLAGLAGSPGTADGVGSAARFNSPEGVAVDAAGNVYVADTTSNTIRKVTPAGEVTTLAGLAGASGTADGVGSAARFFWPTGIAVDGAGTVYVADRLNNRIRKITPAGAVTTLAGSSQGSVDGVGTGARFFQPSGIAVHSTGMMYVVDQFGRSIRQVTPGGAVTTLAGPGIGTADGFGSNAQFTTPTSVAVDGSGTIYVTDKDTHTIRARGPAASGPNLLTNSDFSSGGSGWQLYATPDNSYVSTAVVNGVFQFTRVPPPAGTSNSATVFQNTGQAVPSGTSLLALFALGNSSSVRKRISVLVLDHDFSDLSVCTFWLPPNMPLKGYSMRTYTTKAWTNASIYFYAATEGSNGGAYRVDDVALQVQPDGAVTSTLCLDPLRAFGGIDPTGPSLLGNGDFGTGTLAPWGTFGTITQRIAGGVFEFLRESSTVPSGVVFQVTGQAMYSGELMSATFQLGNSSPVRKRVTVILHDSDFSDLSACTFWLAPGQPLSNYVYRTYATKAWTNAMISFYPATTDSLQWIRLDNVTLQRTPSTLIAGTHCIEPGGGG